MVSVTLSGKPYQCASCKEELTTGQYQRILKEWNIDQPDLLKRDYFKLFNILTNTNCKFDTDELETQQAIWECVAWVITETFEYKKDLPKAIQIGDKILSLPKKVGALSIGQNIILQQIIDNSRYLEENVSIAVATYLQPEYTGSKLSLEKVMEMDQDIQKIPAMVVYPIGFFLLTRADQLGKKSEEDLAPDKKQPKFEFKQGVAQMAQVHKLRKHDRLDPIDRFAQAFGLHPDDVFDNTSFDTVFAFLHKWKDQDEFHERFNYIWSEISKDAKI